MKKIVFTVTLTYNDEEAAGWSPAERASDWLFNEDYAVKWDIKTESDEEVAVQ